MYKVLHDLDGKALNILNLLPLCFCFHLQVKITLEVNDFQDFFDADDEVIFR